MKREENTIYIAAISFGKDSTTMSDLLCKHKYPLDEIIFTDTFQEFSLMYEYAEKVKKYFHDRYGYKITVLSPMDTFEQWCFGVIKDENAKGYGAIRGIPNPADTDSQCFHRRQTKVKPMEDYLKEKYPNQNIVQYIGYTKGEGRSVKNTDIYTYKFPLKNDFKMTEDDCKRYLKEQEMENPLYKFFSRTGCAICPFQAERSMFQLFHNFRDTWEYMRWIENRLDQYEKMGFKVMNKFWFTEHKTLLKMEYKFKQEKFTLMDFSDEPLKDCFCKI